MDVWETCCQVDHAHLIDSVKNALSVCKTSNFDCRPGSWDITGYLGRGKVMSATGDWAIFRIILAGSNDITIWGWISIERTSKLFSRLPVLFFCLKHYLVGGLEHEFYDFPFSWECHHPNWRTHIFQRGRYTPISYKTINYPIGGASVGKCKGLPSKRHPGVAPRVQGRWVTAVWTSEHICTCIIIIIYSYCISICIHDDILLFLYIVY